jgi:methylamine dehydrogenase accessory protein MauD
MDGVLLAARLILAVVFGVAGVAKLLDPGGSREALRGFGLPERLAGPLAALLPLAELATALALIPVASAWWGGIAALALLLIFLAGIGSSLARGKKPDCHCFGQLYSKPVGAETLVRNGVLAVIAGGIVLAGPAHPGANAFGWVADLTAFERVLTVLGLLGLGLLGGLTWLMVEMLRQQGRVLLRLDTVEARLEGRFVGSGPLMQIETNGHAAHGHHAGHDHPDAAPVPGLPIGAPAPDVSLPDLDGAPWTLERLTERGRPLLLVFVDPSCTNCNALLPDIGRWQREHADALTVALVSRGAPADNRRKVAEHDVGPVLLQADFEVATAFEVTGTPSAVLIAPDGAIKSPLAAGADPIRMLAEQAIASRPAAPSPLPVGGEPEYGTEIGALAPPFELPDLDGIKVSSEELRGQRTMLLFWNPGCGFCQGMVSDLKSWETSPPPRAPRLVLVSAGDPEGNRALGLQAPILMDSTGTTARAYGAGGTPMAVLLDADGRVASRMAGGAPGCLALAGFRAQAQRV